MRTATNWEMPSPVQQTEYAFRCRFCQAPLTPYRFPQHPSRRLDQYRGLSRFLLSVRDRDEFFATWYLEFLRTGAQLSQNDHLKTIAKAFVAFVRHGHGTET